MSLADELIADYEDADDDLDEHEAEVESMDIAEVDEKAEVDYKDKETVKNVAKLRDSEQLATILSSIEKYASQPRRQKVAESGPVEADPEYKVIVEANNITVEIDNEINVIHKFTRDHYSKRFPELESLIQTPMEYIKTVKELGNNIMENSKKNEVLHEILVPATIMVVSVTASTTPGTLLNGEELFTVMEACDMAVDLTEYKAKIFSYVESRMTFIAPNVTIIVGASIAAKLMGTAGGLTNLSKMPACNVQSLGAQRKTLSGFSMASIQPHMGFIYNCDIVQRTPPELRKKATRLVSAKCTLASRVDSFHESVDGTVGDSLRAEIDGKLDKLLEPPPVKTVKALPTPIDAARKKRGGRRARKMKERLGLTEVRKAANRMNFGEIEEDAYQDDLGFSLGTLGKSASGRIRGPVVDSKTKAKISKTLQLKVQKQNQTWGGSTTVKRQVSGTASSVAFTPLQGLEIVNPQAAEKKVAGGSSTYFSSTGSFVNVKQNR